MLSPPDDWGGKVDVGLRIGDDEHPPRASFADKYGRRVRLHGMSVHAPFIREHGTECIFTEHPRVRVQLTAKGCINLQWFRGRCTVEWRCPSVVEQPSVDGAHDMAYYSRFHIFFFKGEPPNTSLIGIVARASSIACTCPADSRISAAPMFSFSRHRCRVPGIGTIHGLLFIIHASAICDGVA